MLKIQIGFLITVAAILLAAGSMPAQPQGLPTQKVLTLDAANAIARGALDKCRAQGDRVSVAVIDVSATLKAFMRDEGAGQHTVEVSRRKAYTALTFNQTSGEIGKVWGGLALRPTIDGTTGSQGGVPIVAGKDVIGAVGVSGGHGPADEACANAGIAKIAGMLK